MNVRKNDNVVVLSGKDKGKTGKVLATMPKTDKILVEGVNVATCHVKPRRQDQLGGIIQKEIPLNACKVMLMCPKCNKGTRVAHKILENGEKIRVCKKCGETI